MMSLLYDGCVEKGKSMLSGGIAYLGAILESYGNINTVDSLAAIHETVFDKKSITPDRLLQALMANFEGYELERRLLLKAPKYGNDLNAVDDLASDLHDFEARTIRDQAGRVGLHFFLILDAYFENGGTQAMITVVGRKDLEEAMKNPEKYRSLLVRVGGFSARFVELEKDVQQEVLSRTVH
jgi:pyruvate-formate lyase